MSNPDQIKKIYQHVVSILSQSDRLRLAALTLNALTQQNIVIIDSSDTWIEQDRLELTTLSLQYASSLFPEDEEIV